MDVSPLGFREAADRSKPGVVLVSNRLPATATLVGDRVEIVRSVGGVATGLRGVHERGGRAWVGWPGETPTLDRARKKELTDAFRAQGLEPVDLTTREIKRFYEGFANGVLWPLFHYDLDRIPLDARDFDVYRAVNEKFADAVTRRVSPGDSIWIHDYQLMLLPALLRERLPDARIGYFHHVPFPSSEIFRVLPWRERILEGLLGADLVGFHTHAYARHFASAALRVLGLDAEFDVVRRGDRATRIGVFPMGVDVARHAELASDPDVIAESERFRSDGGEKILVGVDRLDYTKGLRRRLLAFGRLLERRPEFRGRVRFIQVAAPSRSKVDAYAKFRRDVNEIVGRVNGAYGAPDFTPLQYAARSFDEREVAALYRAADAVVVTPLRDGMNLVAKEFVAARTDGDGVLILSETAGAAAELGEALIVNPFDVDSMADAYARALTMPEDERRARMRGLRARVGASDVAKWADGFVDALMEATAPRDASASGARSDDGGSVLEQLSAAPRLLLLLDYDGTLTPFEKTPDLARPDEEILAILRALAAARATSVHLVSGRRREDLAAWFGALPIGLHAEHGLWSRDVGRAEWSCTTWVDPEWKRRVLPVLKQWTAATPGSAIEEKTAGYAWHWRGADPTFGRTQALELRLHLADVLGRSPFETLVGDKVVEVRLRGVDKGGVVRRLKPTLDASTRVFAVGDDLTDEDLFRALPEGAESARVGTGPTAARRRFVDWREVRAFLTALARGREARAAEESGAAARGDRL